MGRSLGCAASFLDEINSILDGTIACFEEENEAFKKRMLDYEARTSKQQYNSGKR